MYNYPEIISPRIEIFKDIEFFFKKFNTLRSELLNLISKKEFNEKNKTDLIKNYST